jgi:hypothetical protein
MFGLLIFLIILLTEKFIYYKGIISIEVIEMNGVQTTLMGWFVGAGRSGVVENEDLRRPIINVKRKAYAYYGNWTENEMVELIQYAIEYAGGKGAEVVILSRKVKVRPIGLKDPVAFYDYLRRLSWIPVEVKTEGSWIVVKERD